MSERATNYPALDGLRGLAAITVVVEHLANAHMPIIAGVPLGGQSRIAVWVFFVLSAFLLTSQSMQVDPGARAAWTLRYLTRRFFRIYPLFIFCVMVDIVVGRATLTEGANYLTQTSPCCGSIYWTIPPEFQFYLAVPLIGAAASRYPRTTLAALFSTALSSIIFARGYNLYGFINTFCFGSIAAILLLMWPEKAEKLSRAWILAPVVALLCSVPFVKLVAPQSIPWDWNGMHGALWAVVVLACALGEPRLAWLSARPLRFLGAISFSLYLTHPCVIALGKKFAFVGAPFAGLTLLVVASAFAFLVFRLVEEPSRAFGKRFEAARTSPIAP